MGIINHNAVIAVNCIDEQISELREWISDLPPNKRKLFLEGPEVINGYRTFVLVPDGSKEGWEDSDRGDKFRQKFIDRLKQDDEHDGSSCWEWIEVAFGTYGQRVIRGNCSIED